MTNSLTALFEVADREFINIRLETERLENQLLESPQSHVTESEVIYLDTFQFLTVVRPIFPSYYFVPYKVDGFVADICYLSPEFTQEHLSIGLGKYLRLVKEYAQFQSENYGNNLNPFTLIRHALYLDDKVAFGLLQFDMQKSNFERWLKENNMLVQSHLQNSVPNAFGVNGASFARGSSG